ncbi:efflux RND transporter periplasmic adaptor subunit [Litoribrevibacter albus]|uniref:MexE family multidrug efflux RND transporter periplasmic adaptor subunit n=1 Tax=Litoribrevibacter albus TaxID=1473156 RepID=A0AA37W5W1_9GAMM|nr:efflux RND transporter periplasmic adaptor subunit [Litoribrevibacter albus]GLQ31015.1 MexE family multidrug efflux RND transporter periplasmic adaptor subunit [Litoribrevibacter albus]
MKTFQRSSLALLSMLLIACSGGNDTQTPANAPLPKVSTIAATFKEVRPTKEFVGKTEAKEDVNIQARVGGYLIKQHVADGAKVNEGDLLFEIDQDTYAAEVAKAEAKVAQDNAALNEASRNYKRGKELISKGAISESQMDQLTSKKLQAEAAIKVSEAALKTAKLNLSYTQIKAPTTGTLSQAQVSIGDLITSSTSLATLVQADPMYVSFQVSERELIEYREERQKEKAEGKPVSEPVAKLQLTTGSEYQHTGKFNFLDNRIDQNTGTIKVRAVFPNPNGFLLPGQHVTLVIEQGNAVNRLVIPQKAIQEDQTGKFVLVLGQDQVIEKRPIQVGQNQGTMLTVTSGLKEGEQIIVDGLQKVRVGGKAESTPAQLPETH